MKARILFGLGMTLAVTGCGWDGNVNINIHVDDASISAFGRVTTTSADAAMDATPDGGASDVTSVADTVTTTDAASASDAATDVPATTDVVATDTPPATDTVLVTDTPVVDTPPPTDTFLVTDTGSTATDTPATDVALVTDTPPASDGGRDYTPGAACPLAGEFHACAVTMPTPCLSIVQNCDNATLRWTECYALVVACSMPDAGTPDAGPADSGVDSRICPCAGAACDFLMHCTTSCHTDGVRTVGLYCSGAPCYGSLAPCPMP